MKANVLATIPFLQSLLLYLYLKSFFLSQGSTYNVAAATAKYFNMRSLQFHVSLYRIYREIAWRGLMGGLQNITYITQKIHNINKYTMHIYIRFQWKIKYRVPSKWKFAFHKFHTRVIWFFDIFHFESNRLSLKVFLCSFFFHFIQ